MTSCGFCDDLLIDEEKLDHNLQTFPQGTMVFPESEGSCPHRSCVAIPMGKRDAWSWGSWGRGGGFGAWEEHDCRAADKDVGGKCV